MPGRSFTRPPRMSTIECSCKLCPTPGIYVVTSTPLVSRTRATLRSAEFGFFGVVVYTRVQTPRFCGDDLSAGALVFDFTRRRPWRTSWFRVGTEILQPHVSDAKTRRGNRPIEGPAPRTSHPC